MGHPHHYGKPVCSEKEGQGVMGGALAVCCKYQHEFRGKRKISLSAKYWKDQINRKEFGKLKD